MRIGRALLLLFAFDGIGAAQGPEKRDAELPANLTTQVQRLGCVILGREGPNVIRGEFGQQRISDWAILCSKARVTTLLVFWGGSGLGPAELWKTFDGDGQHLSSRRILPVDKKYIAAHCESANGKLPLIDHQGILDGFNDSVVHYYYQGKWLHLMVAR